MDLRIALAGNPNSGKTTLFNALTGSNQFVGNWPGVTVEKKEGKLKKHDDVIIMDLPGIYSLSPYTLEKVLALYTGLSEQNPLFRWSIQHANYAYGTADVYEYLQRAKAFTIEPVADQITQDVLLISAREDLMVGFDLYKEEIDLLKSARTLEFAVPGAAIHGQAHCNMGNPQYILDLILNWNNRLLQ